MCYKRPCWCLFKAFKGSIHSHSPLGGGVFAGYSDLLARGGGPSVRQRAEKQISLSHGGRRGSPEGEALPDFGRWATGASGIYVGEDVVVGGQPQSQRTVDKR